MYIIKESAKKIVESYSAILEENDFLISAPVLNSYNYEFRVQKGADKLKILVYFGKSGNKTVVQGNKDTQLYIDVNNLLFTQKMDVVKDEFPEPLHYIGTDESGKGDYFGPLVVAGVIVNSTTFVQLKKIGVKDSKLLSDDSIKKLAPQIKNIVGDKFNIIVITPKTYNNLHAKMKNVNKILGWSHAKVIENLLEKENVANAISDKFGDERLIQCQLQEKGKKINLMQFTKAEKYVAVAAASILARNRFNQWFVDLVETNSLVLPKGASKIVDTTLRYIKEKYGVGYLNEIAKVHFKTTNKI